MRQWDPIVQIYADSSFAVVPRLIANGDTIHLLWLGTFPGTVYQGDSTYRGLMYSHSFDGGKEFSTPYQITDGYDSYESFGHMAASGSDLYVAGTHPVDSAGHSEAVIYCSHDAGLTWQPRKSIAEFGRAITFSGGIAITDSVVYLLITYDSAVVPYVSWVDAILGSRDGGTTWDTISRGGVTMPGRHNRQLMAASRNALHVVWDHWDDSGTYIIDYRRSLDMGRNWEELDTLSIKVGDGIQAFNPFITTDGDSCVYVIWNDQKYNNPNGVWGTILLRRSTDEGRTWLPEQIISQPGTAMLSAISVHDSLVAVTWDNDYYKPPNWWGPFAISVRISPDGGNTWCPVENVIEDTAQVRNPDIAVTRTGVHAVWYDNFISNHDRNISRPEFRTLHRNIESVESASGKPWMSTLEQNYPNPFNPATAIKYSLSSESKVLLTIYNVLGECVGTILDQKQPAGIYRVTWSGAGYASGVYYYRLVTNSGWQMKKMMLIK